MSGPSVESQRLPPVEWPALVPTEPPQREALAERPSSVAPASRTLDQVVPAPSTRFADATLQPNLNVKPPGARAQLLTAVSEGAGATEILATLSRFSRSQLRVLGQDAELRAAITGVLNSGQLNLRSDRVMVDVARRMDLAPDVAQRWLAEAGVFARAPGPVGRPLSPEASAAMDHLEDYGAVYQAMLRLREARGSFRGPGGMADPVAIHEAKAALHDARVAAGLKNLSSLQEAEAHVLHAYTAHAMLTLDASLKESRLQLQSFSPTDPKLQYWLDALQASPPPDEAGWHDAQEIMQRDFPVVAARSIDLQSLALGSPRARKATLIEAVEEARDAISNLEGEVAKDTRLAFTIPGLREQTWVRLGVPKGSALRAAVQAQRQVLAQQQTTRHFIELGASLALAAPSLGGSIWAQAGMVGLSTYAANHALGHYSLQSAARDAHFDGSLALEDGDPSQLWLALDVASLIVDGLVFAGALRQVARSAQRVASGRAPQDSLRRALNNLPKGAVLDEAGFAEAVLDATAQAATDRPLRDEAADLLGDLKRVRSDLTEAQALGLVRLPAKLAWALVEHLPPGLLPRAGQLARDPDIVKALVQLGASETTTSLLLRRDLKQTHSALQRLGRAPKVMSATLIAGLRGPPSARARGLIEGADLHLPLDLNRRFRLSMELKVPVDLDPALSGRAVEVRYQVKEGLVTDIQVGVGPQATRQDILDHAKVVDSLNKFRGLQGALNLTIAKIRHHAGLQAHLPGTAGYEAVQEVSKLERALETSFKLRELPERLASLERQLGVEQARLQNLPAAMGRGRIAVRDPLEEAKWLIDTQMPSIWPNLKVHYEGAEVVVAGKLRMSATAFADVLNAKPETVRSWQGSVRAIAEFEPKTLTPGDLQRVHEGVGLYLAKAPEFASVPKELASVATRIASTLKSGLPFSASNKIARGSVLRAPLGRLLQRVGIPKRLAQRTHELVKSVDKHAPERAADLAMALDGTKDAQSLGRVLHAQDRSLWLHVIDKVAAAKGPPAQAIRAQTLRLFNGLEQSGRVEVHGLVQTLRKIAEAGLSSSTSGYVAELAHAQFVLDGGLVAPGTRIFMGPANDLTRVLEFGPGDHFVFGGSGMPPEADLLFRGVDGRVNLHEVKEAPRTLVRKVRSVAANSQDAASAARKYIAELQRFGRESDQRTTIVFADGSGFWESLAEMIGDKGLGLLLAAQGRDVSLRVGSSVRSTTEVADTLQRLRQDYARSGFGGSFAEFLRIKAPSFDRVRLQ